MENLSSFFELIAAINFAFVLSTHFTTSITKKVSIQFNKIETQIESIKNMHKEICNMLFEKTGSEYKTANIIEELHTKSTDLGLKVSKMDNEIKDLPEAYNIIGNFNYLCLFGSLYPIVILLLIGFKVEFTGVETRHSILLFNILSSLLLWFVLRDKQKYFRYVKSGFFAIVIVFLFSLIAAVIFSLTGPSKWLYFNYDYSLFNKIICVLIPTHHFIYYFILTISKAKRTARQYEISLKGLRDECQEFTKEVDIRLDTVNKMKTVDL